MILDPLSSLGPIRHTSQAGSNLNCDSAVQRFTIKGTSIKYKVEHDERNLMMQGTQRNNLI